MAADLSQPSDIVPGLLSALHMPTSVGIRGNISHNFPLRPSCRQTFPVGGVIVDLPCFLHFLDVSLGPGTYSSHKLDEGSAELGERVLHTWRNTGVKATADDSIALQATQSAR